jgi:hypothetical protein
MARKPLVFLENVMVGTLPETNEPWRFDDGPVRASRVDAFDLSPSLPRAQLAHVDGATTRSVQGTSTTCCPRRPPFGMALRP